MKRLTKKQVEVMEKFWDKGPLFVRELRELYDDPKPHFNTLSTHVRSLEEDGFLDHNSYGPTFQYFAKVSREDYNGSTLSGVIDKYFGNSYLNAVSSLVNEKKITVDDLKKLIEQIESE